MSRQQHQLWDKHYQNIFAQLASPSQTEMGRVALTGDKPERSSSVAPPSKGLIEPDKARSALMFTYSMTSTTYVTSSRTDDERRRDKVVVLTTGCEVAAKAIIYHINPVRIDLLTGAGHRVLEMRFCDVFILKEEALQQHNYKSCHHN